MSPDLLGFLNGGSSVLRGLPSSTSSARADSGLSNESWQNNSGWNVATGQSKVSAGGLPWYVYAGAGLLFFMWMRKK